MSAGQTDYDRRVHSQIAQYAEPEQLQKLGPIYRYWMDTHIKPRIPIVFDVPNVLQIYVQFAIRAMRQPGASRRILSLGAGDCVHEIKVIKKLVELGETNFTLDAIELSPLRFERARAHAADEGVENYLHLEEGDLNTWKPGKKYSAIIAKDTLHHVVELEHLFDGVHEALDHDGAFLTTDMMGRNGHMRWPEALELIQGIWRFIPDHYKTNHQLRRVEEEYVNWDCSTKGFEGIRAQDILGLLVEKFSFRHFLAFGNLPDIFIERAFGHNLSVQDGHDTAFIDFLEQLNTLLIDLGYLKPTMVFAVLSRKRADAPSPRHFRHWTPEFCIRNGPPYPYSSGRGAAIP